MMCWNSVHNFRPTTPGIPGRTRTLIKTVTISELAYTVTRYQDLRPVQRLQPIYVQNGWVAYKAEPMFENYALGNALLNPTPVLVLSSFHFIPGHTLMLRVKSLYTTTGRNP